LIASPRPGVDKAVVLAAFTENDVIEDTDAEELSGIPESLRELDVLTAGLGAP